MCPSSLRTKDLSLMQQVCPSHDVTRSENNGRLWCKAPLPSSEPMEAIHAFCPTGKITLTTVTGRGNPKLAPGGMYSSLLYGVSFMLRGRGNPRGGLASKETLRYVWGDLSQFP